MLFETERLYVTRWMKGNLKSLYNLYNDEATKEFISPKLTIEETKFIFEHQLNDYDDNFPFGRYFIVEKAGKNFIGLLLIKSMDNPSDVEIGYSLIKEEWEKGYATEIVQQVVAWLFGLNKFTTIYAITDRENIKSHHVLDKCGFSPNYLMEKNPNELYFSLTK